MKPSALPLEVEPQSVKAMLAEHELVLVDCRERHEYETARIDGAMLLPMSEWLDVVQQLEPHQDQRIVVYCHHGVRSLRVTNWLREHGYTKSQSMSGGIDSWSQTVDAEVPRY